MKRTEEQQIAKTPILVLLGAEQYEIKPLPIIKARQWRTLLNKEMAEITAAMSASESQANLGPALTSALVAFPEKMADLVFAWEPTFPKDKILEEATEEQLAVAYSACMSLAYPFLAQLQQAVSVTKSL